MQKNDIKIEMYLTINNHSRYPRLKIAPIVDGCLVFTDEVTGSLTKVCPGHASGQFRRPWTVHLLAEYSVRVNVLARNAAYGETEIFVIMAKRWTPG